MWSRELFTRFSFRHSWRDREELAQESEQRGISTAVRDLGLRATGRFSSGPSITSYNAIRYNRPEAISTSAAGRTDYHR